MMISTICDPLVWLGLACVVFVGLLFFAAVIYAWVDRDNNRTVRRLLDTRFRVKLDGFVVFDTSLEIALAYQSYADSEGTHALFGETLSGPASMTIEVIAP